MKNLGLIFGLILLAGCTSMPSQTGDEKNNPLTHGNVQMNLKVGVTTQAQVLETFGAPNITTIDGQGREVWSYQRHAAVTKSNEGYATIILLGGSTSGFEESSRTMTLIIKFGPDKIVQDFNSMSSSF
jgi:outer membrane protein assembly factor BamE (lipoprotein component of BamABCDE complex)